MRLSVVDTPWSVRTDRLTVPRHVRFETDAARDPTTLAPIQGQVTQPAAALLKALDLVDAGWPVDAAAGAAGLTATFLEDRLPVAGTWTALATTKDSSGCNPRTAPASWRPPRFRDRSRPKRSRWPTG